MKPAAQLRMEAARRNAGVCLECGGRLDKTYMDSEVCSGCQVNPYIPDWYPAAEKPVFDEVWGHENATEHPKTGVAMIDTPKPRHVHLAQEHAAARVRE